MPGTAAVDGVATAPTPGRWLLPAWRAQVDGWVHERLAEHGLAVDGEVTQPHLRAWSTALRVPTTGGVVWFKASAGGTAYEPALLAVLARLRPQDVLVPLAVDADRGWSLQPDGGATLRTVEETGARLRRWERVLPQYADLQRTVAAHVDELFAAGVPDLRPGALPGVRAALLDDRGALLLGRPDGLTDEALGRLQAAEGEFVEVCDRLAAGGVPMSIQHDDLHDANVLVHGSGHRIFDWGDASVAHPFGTLLITLRSVADRLGLAIEGPELRRLRDAYLEAWTDLADRSALETACVDASRVTTLSRALSYLRALRDATEEAAAEHAAAVPGWLAEWWEPVPFAR